MCQPGRPLPHGDTQLGSPGFGGLPQGEIHRVLFDLRPRQYARPPLSPPAADGKAFHSLRILMGAEVDIPIVRRIRIALVDQGRDIMLMISSMFSVASGWIVAGRTFKPSASVLYSSI